jgi:hypothetical protein
VILKHPEPSEKLNPTTQVMFRPLGKLQGNTAVDLMRGVVLRALQRDMTDFALVEPIRETKVDKMPAASMRVSYTVADPEGRKFKALSRICIVPRGSFVFVISMIGPQQGPDVSETEFKTMLNSIRIDK